LLGFKGEKRINESILEKIWPINTSNKKKDPYAPHLLSYNEKME
jgi:hypothetical protein